jgi:hypothetical protein
MCVFKSGYSAAYGSVNESGNSRNVWSILKLPLDRCVSMRHCIMFVRDRDGGAKGLIKGLWEDDTALCFTIWAASSGL